MNLPHFPEKPDVYGWLQRDRRGHWFLKGSLVTRRSIIDHFERAYQADTAGRWFVQYGWQRVFVSLAHLPLVFRVDGDNVLRDTAGRVVGAPHRVALDAEGSLMMLTPLGPGAVDDADLGWALERLRVAAGAVDETALAAALALPSGAPTLLRWVETLGQEVVVERLDRGDAPLAFGYHTDPRPLKPGSAPH